jgi:hypothetical protein
MDLNFSYKVVLLSSAKYYGLQDTRNFPFQGFLANHAAYRGGFVCLYPAISFASTCYVWHFGVSAAVIFMPAASAKH